MDRSTDRDKDNAIGIDRDTDKNRDGGKVEVRGETEFYYYWIKSMEGLWDRSIEIEMKKDTDIDTDTDTDIDTEVDTEIADVFGKRGKTEKEKETETETEKQRQKKKDSIHKDLEINEDIN